jgi:hypothetical protein
MTNYQKFESEETRDKPQAISLQTFVILTKEETTVWVKQNVNFFSTKWLSNKN